MLFNSYIFIGVFFPICLLGYYSLQRFGRTETAKIFLVAMSLWFYGYFNVSYLLIMLCSIGMNYLFHRLLSKHPARSVLILSVVCNLGILFYFKYFDFFLSTMNTVFGTSLPLRNILLPLGISFFTFQQISFVADTYRGEVKDCNIIDYALFVSFFPQLIAGPIVNHGEMLPQFRGIAKTAKDEPGAEDFWKRFAQGASLFTLGMAKKVLIADTCGAGVDYGYANLALLGRWDAVFVIVFYTFQLYFDFSGYCDMARGIGRMLGIEIPVNFDSPYKATNIIDFWKRWHITLNRFFTKYVYIPLGGNRKGTCRMYCNLLLVFFLSGVWHGAGWNYIVWGMMHGILYVFTRFYQRNIRDAWQRKKDSVKSGSGEAQTGPSAHRQQGRIARGISRIALFIYVSMAWVYFRAESVSQANQLLLTAVKGKVQKLSVDFAKCFEMDEFWYVIKILHLDNMAWSRYLLMFAALLVCLYLAMIGQNANERIERMKYKTTSAVAVGVLFAWCVLTFSQVSTFLYFNF